MPDDKAGSKTANSVDSSHQTGTKKKPTLNNASPRRSTQNKPPYEEHEDLNKSLVSLFIRLLLCYVGELLIE